MRFTLYKYSLKAFIQDGESRRKEELRIFASHKEIHFFYFPHEWVSNKILKKLL